MTPFLTIVKISLLCVIGVLGACGKTGDLYLPEASPAVVITEPGATLEPGKTQ